MHYVQAIYDFDAQPGTEEISINVGDILTITSTDIGGGWLEGTNSKGETGLFPEDFIEEYIDEDGVPPDMEPPPLPSGFRDNASNADLSLGNQTPVIYNRSWSNDLSKTNTKYLALYDFDAQPGTGELSINANDILTITRTDVGEGWLEGTNSRGEIGIFPEAYVEEYANVDPWGSVTNPSDLAHRDSGSSFSSSLFSEFENPNESTSGPPKNSTISIGDGDINSLLRSQPPKKRSSIIGINRFSFPTFNQSGGEYFVLGKLNVDIQETDIIQIVDNGNGKYSWLNVEPAYNCVVASPKKETKFAGLKSYITYQLKPSNSNNQVSRRYKQFYWLHQRLIERYAFIPIPPLPDKHLQGRYEEEFIEHRRNQLQNFVNRICYHPILSQSEVWKHFLTCIDEKQWKAGKRKAEHDPLVGCNALMTIKTPEKPNDQELVDHEVDKFSKFQNLFESAVINMKKTSTDQTKKCQKYYNVDFQAIGKAFHKFGGALQHGNCINPNLTNAIVGTGQAYKDIAKMFEDQPKNDWEQMGDLMHDYRGLLMHWPAILQTHEGAISKKKELEKLNSEGKFSQNEAMEISNRTDTLSFALLCEINTFNDQWVIDMKDIHQHFLQEQITFHLKVVKRLQDALRMFENC